MRSLQLESRCMLGNLKAEPPSRNGGRLASGMPLQNTYRILRPGHKAHPVMAHPRSQARCNLLGDRRARTLDLNKGGAWQTARLDRCCSYDYLLDPSKLAGRLKLAQTVPKIHTDTPALVYRPRRHTIRLSKSGCISPPLAPNAVGRSCPSGSSAASQKQRSGTARAAIRSILNSNVCGVQVRLFITRRPSLDCHLPSAACTAYSSPPPNSARPSLELR